MEKESGSRWRERGVDQVRRQKVEADGEKKGAGWEGKECDQTEWGRRRSRWRRELLISGGWELQHSSEREAWVEVWGRVGAAGLQDSRDSFLLWVYALRSKASHLQSTENQLCIDQPKHPKWGKMFSGNPFTPKQTDPISVLVLVGFESCNDVRLWGGCFAYELLGASTRLFL